MTFSSSYKFSLFLITLKPLISSILNHKNKHNTCQLKYTQHILQKHTWHHSVIYSKPFSLCEHDVLVSAKSAH